MWELDHKEGWVLKNQSFWNFVWKKTLESPLNCKETKAVNLKANQPWIFIGRTDAEGEIQKLWPPDAKGQLILKDSNANKDRWQDDKGVTEDEMFSWNHQINGHEFD